MTTGATVNPVASALDSHISGLSDAGHVSVRDDWPHCRDVAQRLAINLRADPSMPDITEMRALPQQSAALMARMLASVLASAANDDIGTSSFGHVMVAYGACSLRARGTQPALLYDFDALSVPYLPPDDGAASLRVSGVPVHIPPDVRNAALLDIGDAYDEASNMVAGTVPADDKALAPHVMGFLSRFAWEARLAHVAGHGSDDDLSRIYGPLAATEEQVLHDAMGDLQSTDPQLIARRILQALLDRMPLPDLYSRDIPGVGILATVCDNLSNRYARRWPNVSPESDESSALLLAVGSAELLAEHFRSLVLDMGAGDSSVPMPTSTTMPPPPPSALIEMRSKLSSMPSYVAVIVSGIFLVGSRFAADMLAGQADLVNEPENRDALLYGARMVERNGYSGYVFPRRIARMPVS